MLSRRMAYARVVFTFLGTVMLGLSLTSLASAGDRRENTASLQYLAPAGGPSENKPAVLHRQDIKEVQETLRD